MSLFRRFLPFLCCMLLMAPLWSHRLSIFPVFDGLTITIRVSFAANAPASGVRISVLDAQQNVLSEGLSDNAGHYKIEVIEARELLVIADDGNGHRAQLTITQERLENALTKANQGQSDLLDGPSIAATPWLRFILGLSILLSLSAVAWWFTWGKQRA